jgi:hypothetical protein
MQKPLLGSVHTEREEGREEKAARANSPKKNFPALPRLRTLIRIAEICILRASINQIPK